jgi:hypothetical protein
LSVCMAKWVRSRASGLHITMSQRAWGLIPGAGMVNQAVHPSGVGKLVAVSKKWVTTAEDCDR